METNTNLTFNIGDRIGLQGLLTQRFFHAALERGLKEVSTFDIRSEAVLDDVDKLFTDMKDVTRYAYLPADPPERARYAAYMYDLGDTLIFAGFNSRYNWETMGVGRYREKLDATMAKVMEALPLMRSGDPNIVPVNFWSGTADNVRVRVRRIYVPSWTDMAINYTEPTKEQLIKLMEVWPPIDDTGRLILWHGIPGTGKSYGIRSLAQSWQKWCDIHYIVDPERFFGDADYMLQVILQNETCSAGCDAPAMEGSARDEDYTGPRWNLLIMEDSDEFLAVDAKQRKGQSMSRLLNLTSGFIGQGLNVLMLITTNEEIGNIHAALQREGRCMANIEFGNLTKDEAQAWAGHHDIPADVDVGESTIADLYALGRQKQLKTGGKLTRPLGFQGTRGRTVQVPQEASGKEVGWGFDK